jgi:hypothetical protein
MYKTVEKLFFLPAADGKHQFLIVSRTRMCMQTHARVMLRSADQPQSADSARSHLAREPVDAVQERRGGLSARQPGRVSAPALPRHTRADSCVCVCRDELKEDYPELKPQYNGPRLRPRVPRSARAC